MTALQAVAFLGIGRRRLREILRWADHEPGEAAIALRAIVAFCRHRARLLEGRRWAWRQEHRIRRNRSAADELANLAAHLERGDVKRCRAEVGEP